MYLPLDHHVARHVPYKKQLRDPEGNPVGILPQAFELRESRNEKSLSVDWLEFFGGTHVDNIENAVKSARKRLNVGLSSIFGVGNVGDIQDVCSEQGHTKVRVLHNDKKPRDSHVQIIRLPMNDMTIMQSLAINAFTELVMNKDIP